MAATTWTWRRICGGCLVAALAVQAWLGLALMVELGRRDAKTEGMFESEDARLQRALGRRYPIYEALRDLTPPHSLIFCNLVRKAGEPGAGEDVFLLQRLRHSLHPRFVLGLDFRDPASRATLERDPVDWSFDAGGMTYRGFVAEFRPELEGDPPAPLQKLAERDGFELWGIVE